MKLINFDPNKAVFSSWGDTPEKTPDIYQNPALLFQYSAAHYSILCKGDKAILPVLRKKKWGMSFYIQAPFFQKTRFVDDLLNDDLRFEALQFLSKSSLYTDICLPGTQLNDELINRLNQFYYFTLRKNYVLTLQKNWDDLYNSMSDNHKRNIRKSIHHHSSLSEPNHYINFYEENQFYLRDGISRDALRNFYTSLSRLKSAEIICPCVLHDSKIVSGGLFVLYGKRIYYFSGASLPGYTLFPVHRSVIEKYAGSDYMLDFEGSELQGVARYFAGFGAYPETYYRLISKKIPPTLIHWYKKLLKRTT